MCSSSSDPSSASVPSETTSTSAAPAEAVAADGIGVGAVVAAAAVDVDDLPAEPEEVDDPLARFAIAAAQQQAAERGEEDDGVDMSFINRALAESRRMRGETSKSQQKRTEQMAALCARHGEQSAQVMAAAMAEHAAEVLVPPQATGVPEGESTELTASEAEAAPLA